ncbi:MAG: hypothetical protein ABW098_07970 [Candidatus Thiodiazotropha sp.]
MRSTDILEIPHRWIVKRRVMQQRPFPMCLSSENFAVKVIRAERIFLEKATILHLKEAIVHCIDIDCDLAIKALPDALSCGPGMPGLTMSFTRIEIVTPNRRIGINAPGSVR